MVFEKYNQLGAYHYDRTIGATGIDGFDIRMDARYRTSVALLGPESGEFVLDSGCGEGVAGFLCVRRGARVKGVDSSIEACRLGVSIARKMAVPEAQISFQACDVMDLPFAAATFDGVLCLEIIEHLVDPLEFLSEQRRVMLPGARIVVSTPHKRIDNVLRDKYHIREYDGFTLASLMRKIFLDVRIFSGWTQSEDAFFRCRTHQSIVATHRAKMLKSAATCGFNILAQPRAYDSRSPILYASAFA